MRKVALITGSNTGIGLAIAWQLARAGYAVAINSNSDQPDDHACAARITQETGAPSTYLEADLSVPKEARALVQQTHSHFGRLDVLVNNAGIQHVAPVEHFPTERWDAVIALNLSAAFHTTSVAVTLMREAGFGRIINIASAHGLRASPNKSAYVAAKHGLVGFTKAVALELAGSGVTCNAICPGFVLTRLVEKQIAELAAAHPDLSHEEVIRDLVLQKQPSKTFVMPEAIGDAAVFLASAAADGVTGTTMSIDGGWTAQ